MAIELVKKTIKQMHAHTIVPSIRISDVELANQAWIDRFGLAASGPGLHRYAQIRCGSCASHAYPAASQDTVALAADLIGWLFLFDDEFGELDVDASVDSARALYASCTRLIQMGQLPVGHNGYHRALFDIRGRVSKLWRRHAPDTAARRDAGELWLERLAASMATFFEGCLLERRYRHSRTTPSVDEYRELRLQSIGMYPVFDLIELAQTAILSERDLRSPLLQRLKVHAALACSWVNDVYSWAKETRAGDPLNIVSVLGAERGTNLPGAFAATAEMFNDDVAAFHRDKAALFASDASQALRRYATGLEDWIHGNYSWTGTCGRYEAAVAPLVTRAVHTPPIHRQRRIHAGCDGRRGRLVPGLLFAGSYKPSNVAGPQVDRYMS